MPDVRVCFKEITEDPTLSFAQKARALALAAENSLEYPKLDTQTAEALEERVICDMYEGHAPYKPRYVLPDYSVVLTEGSSWLELAPATTLDEAINTLMIAYHHVPSVTNMPVFLGHLDALLLPFCDDVSDEALYSKIKLFWRYLDRVLPDAFMHANIGPTDNRVARTILKVDAELKQVAPNLTFIWDPQLSSEGILALACDCIIECSKPHIANHPIHTAVFGEEGYGIASCYNALPLGGGASTLTRLNLYEVARRSKDTEDFFATVLPHYIELNCQLTEVRIKHLFETSGFFDSFLVKEGWIHKDRFAAMFGVFSMAEAVNLLQEKEGRAGRYGHDDSANALGYRISEALAAAVTARPMAHVWRNRAMLHAQAGLSDDGGCTPGLRIPYGTEPDPVTHVQALAPQHQFYPSGVSDILTLDETVRNNRAALVQLVKGALSLGFREFTANIAHNDLVRVTGYMVRLSDIKRFQQCGGSRINTTVLGAEAAETGDILHRAPRVVAHEFTSR
ncbi:YjjI family glycine radical enzyme [Pseudovibrio exalbescens]|uniref:YjjI family glycine radical enzyme n=1 Tax=Pseudovibrio exalbescens TaxID=197461 RepID=A0A1U7JKL4_9HYPH|nr:YjjI family glycine radical enzyme [Pseudovibrio exalbescens]OKL45234.1 YjjI family glycine radical enzyme [Pseudovibrio exalbescens]